MLVGHHVQGMSGGPYIGLDISGGVHDMKHWGVVHRTYVHNELQLGESYKGFCKSWEMMVAKNMESHDEVVMKR